MRVLGLTTLLRTTGRGMFITVSMVYLSRFVGLTTTEIGIALTAGAVVGLMSGPIAGYVADWLGPRRVTTVLAVLEGAAIIAYTQMQTFATVAVLTCLVACFEAGAFPARNALLAGAVAPDQRVRARSQLRVVTNVGWAVGAGIASLALHAGERGTYVLLIALCGALCVTAGLIISAVPLRHGVESTTQRVRWTVGRDRPYLVLAGLNGLLYLSNGVLTVAVPLWTIGHTSLPTATVALLIVLNTVIVVLFQIRVGRTVTDARSACRAQLLAGVFLLAACVLYGVAAGRPDWFALTALVVATLTHTVAEMLFGAASWHLSHDLAPDDAQGQYQGVFGMAMSVSDVAAPIVFAVVLLGWGLPGWLSLGLVFAAAGTATRPVVRWARWKQAGGTSPRALERTVR